MAEEEKKPEPQSSTKNNWDFWSSSTIFQHALLWECGLKLLSSQLDKIGKVLVVRGRGKVQWGLQWFTTSWYANKIKALVFACGVCYEDQGREHQPRSEQDFKERNEDVGHVGFRAAGRSEIFSQRDYKFDLACTEVSGNVAIDWFPYPVVQGIINVVSRSCKPNTQWNPDNCEQELRKH